MPETVTPAAESKQSLSTQSLADYVRQENTRERNEKLGTDDGPKIPSAEAISNLEPPADASETPEAATAADQTDSTQRNADGTFKKRDQPEKRDAIQARIDKATAKQREAERRADAAEARARDLEARQPSKDSDPATAPNVVPPVATDAEPTLEQFVNHPDPLAAYTKAVAQFAVAQAMKQRDAEAAAKADQEAFATRAEELVEQGRATHPDWDAVMDSDFARTFVFPPHVVAAIQTAANGHDLMHYLGAHPDESRALAALPPVAALVELGALSSRVTAAPSGSDATPRRSQAKPLIKPVSASSVVPRDTAPDPATTSLKDWIRHGNATDRRSREALRGVR